MKFSNLVPGKLFILQKHFVKKLNMSNISTTSSNSPDFVKDELVKALNSRGIDCTCKGYLIKGKQQAAGKKVCKLSFELEVCLIPTTTNTNGSVVGIRRKRLKGDAWSYKKVCEEVLKMADLCTVARE